MKNKRNIGLIIDVISIVSVFFLFLQNCELSRQTEELREQNKNMEDAISEERNQTEEMKINNYLNNERLLFNLKEYLIKTRVNSKNNESYVERLKTFIIAKRFRINDSTEYIEIPNLDLSLCNLNNEKKEFQNIDFVQSKLPILISNSNFSGSILNLDSKNMDSESYLFKNCSFINTHLNDRKYYKIIFYKCDLNDVNLLDKSNVHEILAVECYNTKSLLNKGISVMTENELKEDFSFLREKMELLYGELLNNSVNSLSIKKDFIKNDSLVLKNPYGEEFTVYNHTTPIMEESIEKYNIELSLFDLRKSQLRNLDFLKSY